MKLYLKGHDYRFAVEQILVVLFPGEKPEYPEGEPCGDFAEVSLKKTKKQISACTKLVKDGKLSSCTSVLPLPQDDDVQEYDRRARQVIRTSFFKASKKACGISPEWGAMTGIRPGKVAQKLLEQGESDESVDKILKNAYYVKKKRRDLCLQVAHAGIKASLGGTDKDISVYVGIPFCVSRCKYCSFVSHSIDKAQHLVEPYLDALVYEMENTGRVARELGLNIKSVYIGGGTPTSLSAAQLERVMKALNQNFDLSSIEEYTVEAGRPDTVDKEKLKVIFENGATRISANPQTMDDRVLELMGRHHTAQDIVKMVSDIRACGDIDINMDVIAGLPGDNIDGFTDTIERVIKLGPENITVHTLAIKKGSTLKDEGVAIPDGEETLAMVEYAQKALKRAGYAPYYLYRQKYMSGNLENVGYARDGRIGLYNIYIMDELHTILSLGAGGVTKLVNKKEVKIERIFNHKYPYEYNNAQNRLEENAEKIRNFYSEK